MKIIVFVIGIFLISAAALAQENEKKIYKAAIDKDGIQRVSILAGSFFFDPDYIQVKVNIPVEITIKKEAEITPHYFVIDAPAAGLKIKESLSAKPQVIRFKPTKIGKYQFYCDEKFLFFKSHRARGMEGILEVTE